MVKVLPERATRVQTAAGCVSVTHWNEEYDNEEPLAVPPCRWQT